MIPVKVREVVLDPVQNPLLLLVDLEETMVLPIGIGFWEAQSIVIKLQGHIPPRPMTHDLFQSVCGQLDTAIEKVIISEMRDNTFFAELYLKTAASREFKIDARPSDAVALALTVGCPIYITEKIAAHTVSISDLPEQSAEDLVDRGDADEGGSRLH